MAAESAPMPGMGERLIGLGHDLQSLPEFESAVSLRAPGVFFSEAEIRRCQKSPSPLRSLGAVFSSKEALFKALPPLAQWFWTDAELEHDPRGAPVFRLHGSLRDSMQDHRWRTALAISHSGDYVSAVVLVMGETRPRRKGRA